MYFHDQPSDLCPLTKSGQAAKSQARLKNIWLVNHPDAMLGMVINLTRGVMKKGNQPLVTKTDFIFQLFMAGTQRA